MHPSIYSPSEDSYLMSRILKQQLPKFLEKNPDLAFLEIWVGSGIQLKTALKAGIKNENIFSCDVNPEAVANAKKLGFYCIQ